VRVTPEAFTAAAQDLTRIGSAIRSANSAAAVSTTQVAVAAQDEVSAAIAGLFGDYGQQYQALMAQAGQFHDEFVQSLSSSAGAYAAAEAANAAQTPIRQDSPFVPAQTSITALDQFVSKQVEGDLNQLALLFDGDVEKGKIFLRSQLEKAELIAQEARLRAQNIASVLLNAEHARLRALLDPSSG
jgi:hypothetical protein